LKIDSAKLDEILAPGQLWKKANRTRIIIAINEDYIYFQSATDVKNKSYTAIFHESFAHWINSGAVLEVEGEVK